MATPRFRPPPSFKVKSTPRLSCLSAQNLPLKTVGGAPKSFYPDFRMKTCHSNETDLFSETLSLEHFWAHKGGLSSATPLRGFIFLSKEKLEEKSDTKPEEVLEENPVENLQEEVIKEEEDYDPSSLPTEKPEVIRYTKSMIMEFIKKDIDTKLPEHMSNIVRNIKKIFLYDVKKLCLRKKKKKFRCW